MKSRIINSEGKLIAYKQEKYHEKLKRIADKLGMRLVIAEKDDAMTQIGFYEGQIGYEKNDKKCETENGCLIFSGLKGKQIDKVLEELHKNNVEIPLKAAVTTINRDWSIKKLVEELLAERKHFGG